MTWIPSTADSTTAATPPATTAATTLRAAGPAAPSPAGSTLHETRPRCRTVVVAAAANLAVAAALALALAPLPGHAQLHPRSPGPLTAEGPLSVRTLGLAGALPLHDRDPDLLFGNPALVQRARGAGLARLHPDPETRITAMAAGTEWLGGGAALGLRHAEYPALREGGPGLPGEGAGVGERVRETALTLGYARLAKGVRVGVALTGAEVRQGEDSAETGWLDAGAAYDIGPVTVGVSGGGLGPGTDLPGWGAALPRWGRVGLASRAAPVGPLDLGGFGNLTVREGRGPEAGGGVEVGWWPRVGRTLVARAGVGRSQLPGASPWSLGAAFLGDSLTLEYGWRPGSGDGSEGAHGVALRFR